VLEPRSLSLVPRLAGPERVDGAAIDAVNRPLKDLRISVIEACNYRCPYCMPEGSTP